MCDWLRLNVVTSKLTSRLVFMCTAKFFFFFNDTATTEIYTLSLHDALPIWAPGLEPEYPQVAPAGLWESSPRAGAGIPGWGLGDRKSTRLNSSHANISYAVFCLKKKKKNITRLMFLQ